MNEVGQFNSAWNSLVLAARFCESLEHLELAARRIHRYFGFLVDKVNDVCNSKTYKKFQGLVFS